ncbi:MAG: 4Fe-4S dicluster domain-containing protein [Alphaproteobacteria bacterium]|nr:4Fe-4S dicluster domain-containing protein [Alphaproteobacteria bacterium]
MEIGGKKVLVCDCEATMTLDGNKLAKACGAQSAATIHTQLCRAQIENFEYALGDGGGVVVACTQESPLFRETAMEGKSETPITFTNIRENAGWSAEASAATPKIAALLAEATISVPGAPSVSMSSEGVCLVYGRDEVALAAARQLSSRLDVTLLLSKPGAVIPPAIMDIPIFAGTIASARGHLGAFEIVVNSYAPMIVSSRQELAFHDSRDGAASNCDLILDLSGGDSLFPAPEKRDGYFRPDPNDPVAVQRVLFELTDMVGEFEKPRYVTYTPEICAHSRSEKTGCTRCLDVCPASAIAPNGDHVEIDPYICGGCGGCHSVCPTGAASYALPPLEIVLERLRTMLSAYHKAGGERPALLVHDGEYGSELISMMSRFGRGLPARVIPFAVNEVTQIGFEFLSAALAYGAERVFILVPPRRRDELSGLAGQIGLAEAAASGLGYGGGRVAVLDETDPDAVEAALYAQPQMAPMTPGTFLAMGNKRNVITLSLDHLHKHAPEPIDLLPLPHGAPFGHVSVDTQGCTLCLACVGACPTGALIDNPDRPQLSFQEAACIQCGLCQSTCPESVISLQPRFNFTEEARRALVVKEEEPFNCVRCGKPFGTKSSIERIVEELGGRHAMFKDAQATERLKMCDDCRVIVQFEAGDDPFGGAPRPRVRTTEDYLREPEIEKARQDLLSQRKDEAGEDGD